MSDATRDSPAKRPDRGLIVRALLPPFALLAALLLLPESLDSPARWALAITAGTLAAWVLEPVPLSATSIPILFLLAATGAASPDGAVSGFGSSATLLLVTGFMMAAALEKTPSLAGSPIASCWACL